MPETKVKIKVDEKHMKELERIRKERERQEKAQEAYIEGFTNIVAEKVVSILLDKFDIKPKKEGKQ